MSRLDFAPSIEEMRVDLWAGTLEFTPKPGEIVTAASLKKAIADAGYSVRAMVITIRGELIPGSGRPMLQLPDTGQRFVLQQKSFKHPNVRQMVRVTGRFEAREEGPDIIFVGEGLAEAPASARH